MSQNIYRGSFKRAYHGTSKAALASILKEGIVPRASPGADTWAEVQLHKEFRRTATQSGVYLSTVTGIAAAFSQFAAQVRENVIGQRLVEGGVVLEVDLSQADPAKIEADRQFNYFEDDAVKAMVYRGAIPPQWIKSYCEVHPTGGEISLRSVEDIESPPLALGDPIPVAA